MKKLKVAVFALVLAGLASMTAYAGTWEKDSTGWWYNNGNGTWPASSWQWIDSNGDGSAECYYFNQSGYLLQNTTTPDGYTVDADGAWTVNGAVQLQSVSAQTTATSTTVSNFPRLEGTFHDRIWTYVKYIVHTRDDGTLQLYKRNTDGSQGELHLEMAYIGNNRWSDGDGTILYNNAWYVDENFFRVSEGGYIQLNLYRK